MKKIISIITCLALAINSAARPLEDIFPALDTATREAVFSEEGWHVATATSGKQSPLKIPPAVNSGVNTAAPILAKNPRYIFESIMVIPDTSITLLALYNAIGNIQGLKGRLYHSFTRGKDIPLFEDATRLVSEKKTTAIHDPPPATSVPPAETIYVRLKDANFGNTHYRADVSAAQNALVFSLSNFKTISITILPLVKEAQFNTTMYFERIDEGLLFYRVSGIAVSDFADKAADIPSAIQKRLDVISDWIIDGVTK
jgi:hypothetical protein